jgi:hypothetical protein
VRACARACVPTHPGLTCSRRDLLGETTWHAPLHSLNATHHLQAARLVLMQYDIVVPNELPKELTSHLIAFGAGWPASYTDVSAVTHPLINCWLDIFLII